MLIKLCLCIYSDDLRQSPSGRCLRRNKRGSVRCKDGPGQVCPSVEHSSNLKEQQQNMINEEIWAREGVTNVSRKIREARLKWLGHVERKTEEDVVMKTWKLVDTERWEDWNWGVWFYKKRQEGERIKDIWSTRPENVEIENLMHRTQTAEEGHANSQKEHNMITQDSEEIKLRQSHKKHRTQNHSIHWLTRLINRWSHPIVNNQFWWQHKFHSSMYRCHLSVIWSL